MTYELSDLSRSVFSSLGVTGLDDPLSIGTSPGNRECILLVDGMGKNAIDKFSRDFPNIGSLHYDRTLKATFPSTTATSLTSLGTGRRAGEHGMVGYTMRVPHSGRPERLLNALKWDERIDPHMWQPHDTLFEIAMAQGISVSHVSGKRYENTGFTRAALRGGRYRGANSLTELVAETIESLKSDQSFVYLYLNDVDEASHGEGFGSEKFLTGMRKVDSLIGQLTTMLPKGTRLWVTSDHGMINRGEYCVLGKENHLLEDVSLLGGEPRSRYLYVEESKIEKIRTRWRDFFGSQVEIYSRDEAISHGLFGPKVLDQVIERIGDLIVVAQGDLILVEPDREALQLAMVGHHGGLTADESEIPLLSFTA